MTEPFARPTTGGASAEDPARAPKAFAPNAVAIVESEPDFNVGEADEIDAAPLPRGMGWLGRLAWSAGGLLVSLGLGLAADRLIEDLFARYQWLGWAGVALLAAFGVALLAIIVREIWAVRRLRTLDHLKAQSAADVVAEEAEWMLGGSKALLMHLATVATVPADVTDTDRANIDTALKALPVATSFGLYDATGAAFGGAGAAGLPASIGELEVFKALAAGMDFAISRQIEDAATGAPLFVLAKRLTAPEGFGGAAVITISGTVMQELWTPQQLGAGSTVGLLLPDGWLIARYPAASQAANSSQQPLFTTLAGQNAGTYYSPRSPVDGVARMVGFRRLPGLGVIAIASVSEDAALAGLRNCLCEAMRAAGFGNRASPHFLPHMTLLYDRRMVAERAIEPVYLTVRDFALVHSLVPQSRHMELARWPLQR